MYQTYIGIGCFPDVPWLVQWQHQHNSVVNGVGNLVIRVDRQSFQPAAGQAGQDCPELVINLSIYLFLLRFIPISTITQFYWPFMNTKVLYVHPNLRSEPKI